MPNEAEYFGSYFKRLDIASIRCDGMSNDVLVHEALSVPAVVASSENY
jgi:hypothetical protein